jgi:myo-inositol-1(or 4)-monophosphatase
LPLLTEAALRAGGIAMRFWKRKPKVWDKGDGRGPVTEADLAVNDMLAQCLRRARPDYGWLSEESEDGAARLQSERLFIIDPIDGTRAFLAGEACFAHSLAVAERGRVTAAVVYLPALDLIYSASDRDAAMRGGEAVAASGQATSAGATVLTSRPSLAPEHWPGGVPQVRRSFRASLAYRLCLVAEGQFDATLTLRPAREWDIAAGALIAARAGAQVTDRHGAALVFNAAAPQAAGVIAAAPGVHADLLARLSGCAAACGRGHGRADHALGLRGGV